MDRKVFFVLVIYYIFAYLTLKYQNSNLFLKYTNIFFVKKY